MKESLIARIRERSQDAENIRDRDKVKIRKTRDFETSTLRESSNFERMKAKMIVLHDEDVASKIQNVLHRADSALEREREREREREFTVAVEKREDFISEVDEEESRRRKTERERDRSRDRERSSDRRRRDRDREQAEQAVMSKET